MMQQQTPAYSNMMSNQQPNVYNTGPGNPAMNRTANQTPMPMSNQQWQNTQAMNVGRQPPNPYNQVNYFPPPKTFRLLNIFIFR